MDQALEIKSALVNKYIAREKEESQNVLDSLEKVGQEGLPLFEKNVKIWLSSMWDEIDELSTPFYEIKCIDGNTPSVTFAAMFTWNGCEGIITTSGWGRPFKSYGPATFLKMYVTGRFPVNKWPEGIKLPVAGCMVQGNKSIQNGDYTECAQPVDETALGKLLVAMIGQLDRGKAEAKAYEELIYNTNLKILEEGFDQLEDIPSIQQYLAQICASNPDNLDRWNAAAKRRTLEIEAQQSKEREARELAELEESERQRLADMAADLFHPFTVYKLSIAVYFPDEQDIRLFHAFVTTSTPDEAGWFVCVQRGHLIPHYRPDSPVVDVTRIDIESASHPDAPEVCGHVELLSEKLPYISEYALSTPEGLE